MTSKNFSHLISMHSCCMCQHPFLLKTQRPLGTLLRKFMDCSFPFQKLSCITHLPPGFTIFKTSKESSPLPHGSYVLWSNIYTCFHPFLTSAIFTAMAIQSMNLSDVQYPSLFSLYLRSTLACSRIEGSMTFAVLYSDWVAILLNLKPLFLPLCSLV